MYASACLEGIGEKMLSRAFREKSFGFSAEKEYFAIIDELTVASDQTVDADVDHDLYAKNEEKHFEAETIAIEEKFSDIGDGSKSSEEAAFVVCVIASPEQKPKEDERLFEEHQPQ